MKRYVEKALENLVKRKIRNWPIRKPSALKKENYVYGYNVSCETF